MQIERNFYEFPIIHDGHVVGHANGEVTLQAWGSYQDFDWKVAEIYVEDAETGKPFRLDLNCPLAVSITEWIMKNLKDLIEEEIFEAAAA